MQKLNEEKENCMEIEKLDTRTLNNGTSMPIGKNFFRAKLKDRKQWIEGFYCRINETTYCTTDDYQKEPVKVQHLIATERSTDWGMPNQIAFYEIDPATLCQYTGISKKNKKIWENDIICHHGIYAPIRYGEYQSSFDLSLIHIYLFFFSSFTLIIGLLRKKKGAKNMCKKSKKMVGGVLLCIGFLIVAGAVGGIDGDTIDLLPGALQIMIGFILSGVGIEYGELFNPPVMEIENLQEDTNETENI